jgi:hypothetical protein
LDYKKTKYWDFFRQEKNFNVRYILKKFVITFDWTDEEACFQFDYWCWIFDEQTGGWQIFVY